LPPREIEKKEENEQPLNLDDLIKMTSENNNQDFDNLSQDDKNILLRKHEIDKAREQARLDMRAKEIEDARKQARNNK
ncbi:hypothetical protein, partial [Mycoplasmopsis verecunda]